MDQINSIGSVQAGKLPEKAAGIFAGKTSGPSFKETLNTFMKDVNDLQLKADESIEKMVAGEITDVHQVMTAAEEANTAFNMMMEIRNKVMDAYQEVQRMRL
jgi:flagellar hook-basal body complex protein FliE